MTLIHLNAPAVAFREVGQLFIASFERPSFLVDTTQETTQEATQEAADITTRKPLKNHLKTTEKPLENKKETPRKRQRNTKETFFETTLEKILNNLQDNPGITRKQLAVKTGVSEDGVKYHLKKLKAAGLIRHVGPTKAGYWEILDPKAPDPIS